jgi:hypothetical protein
MRAGIWIASHRIVSSVYSIVMETHIPGTHIPFCGLASLRRSINLTNCRTTKCMVFGIRNKYPPTSFIVSVQKQSGATP